MRNKAESPVARPPSRFQFVGGQLCLDFCNTVGGLRGAVSREYLPAYVDFIHWCREACLLDEARAEALLRQSVRRSDAAAAAHAQAIELREALYRIFLGLSQKTGPPAVDLKRLNGTLAGTLGGQRVAAHAGGFAWTWCDDEEGFVTPLGPIAHSAADLLTSPELLRQVRRCEGDNCGWLFVDSTKNHSRRWCDMRDCGNRAKARRFRSRQRRARRSR